MKNLNFIQQKPISVHQYQRKNIEIIYVHENFEFYSETLDFSQIAKTNFNNININKKNI